MANNFPTSLNTTTELPNDQTDGTATNRAGTDHAVEHATLSDAVRAAEAKIGIGSSTPTAAKLLAATATGTSGWSDTVAVGAGDNVAINTTENPLGQRAHVYQGTAASPITTGPGNTLRVTKHDGITQATRDGWTGITAGQQTTDDTAAIVGAAKGSAASQLQTVGVCGVAQNAGSTTGGSAVSGPDACAVLGHAWISDASAVGRAIGAYFAGRSDVSAAKISGVEIQCQNRGGTPGTFDSVSTPGTVGLLMGGGAAAADEDRACGICFNHGTGAARWDVGIGFLSNDGGPIVTSTIVDGSASVTVFDINGSHTDGIDTVGATFSGSAVKLGAGHNIALDTATGTKVGTGATQKIGFWNATPVVQSTGWSVTNESTDKSFDANSYTMDELADVLGTLIETLKTYGFLGS